MLMSVKLLTLADFPWWGILLVVLGVLFGLYIVFTLLVIFFLIGFRTRLKKTSSAIYLLINQRYELVNKIEKYFLDLRIKFPPYVEEANEKLNLLMNVVNVDETKRKETFLALSEVKTSLLFFIEQEDKYFDDTNYLTFKDAYQKTEDEYRRLVAIFNSDAQGYNYWVRCFYCRYIIKWLGFKKIEKII